MPDSESIRIPIEVELHQEEKDLIEVSLGHLAKEKEHQDSDVAEQFRDMISQVRDEQPLYPLDWHTVWTALNNKEKIEFPAQPYDENKIASSAMEKIEEALWLYS